METAIVDSETRTKEERGKKCRDKWPDLNLRHPSRLRDNENRKDNRYINFIFRGARGEREERG